MGGKVPVSGTGRLEMVHKACRGRGRWAAETLSQLEIHPLVISETLPGAPCLFGVPLSFLCPYVKSPRPFFGPLPVPGD